MALVSSKSLRWRLQSTASLLKVCNSKSMVIPGPSDGVDYLLTQQVQDTIDHFAERQSSALDQPVFLLRFFAMVLRGPPHWPASSF